MVAELSSGQGIRFRKREHLDIFLDSDVSSRELSNGFDEYEFIHQGLPEINLSAVDTRVQLFGRSLAAPILISPMVGGIEEAIGINRNLARSAQALGLAMGVGSQRCGIDDPETTSTYYVRDIAPDILLFANLGAIQLNNGYSVAQCRQAVDMIGADCLVLHLNPLQEALQASGNTNFVNLLSKIEEVCRLMPVPVIVKEVGFGISEPVAAKLLSAGVSGIDVAGAGGTSFSRIERLRANRFTQSLDDPFITWGIRTADSLNMVMRSAPGIPVIASGGIRTGVDIAKAIALGADAVGIGGPLLKTAAVSTQDVIEYLNDIIEQLRIAMFCIGASTVSQLKGSPLLKHR
jgi:isopentenyl-diphosphate Delta-isomerase